MKSAPAIAFDYRPSRWLLAAIACIWLLAVAGVTLSGLATWLQVAALACVCASAGRTLRRLLRAPRLRCAWHDSGHWRVRDGDGEEHAATLLHAAVRGPLIVLVLLAGPLRRVCLILLPDNSDADVQRRLRVRLARQDTGDGTAARV